MQNLKYGFENKEIVNRYRGLLRACRNRTNPAQTPQISKAYRLAVELYHDLETPTGVPYIFHAINVARISVEEMGLGSTSVIASLLQGTITNNLLGYNDIEKQFGKPVADIVEGLSKISSIDPKNTQAQADSFRELILSLSSDARVILIKLAERLETMRTLDGANPSHQLKISWEAFNLFAPLGHRLGLYKLKSEMEDLAMKYTNEDDYRHITQKLKSTTTKRNRLIKEFMEPVDQDLAKVNLVFDMKGRPKSVYSIWKKMQKQGVTFDEVYDVFAIRIILDSSPEREKADCWQVYSLITDIWKPNPERLRDWISVPKSNGYESLHTTVIGPEGKWVEVQIRSKRMDEVAERGLAAHWKYKGVQPEKTIDQWVNRVREILETPTTTPEELVNEFQLSLSQKEVFIFTPKGDLKKFPQGASVLDFAFDVHTDVGSKCTGAKVNGRIVPIKHILKNGDVVEIITSKNQKPRADWLQHVISSKAKTKIKQSIKEEKNKQILPGKEMLYRRLKNWKVENAEQAIYDLTKHLKLKNSSQLFELIALDKINLLDYKSVLLQQEKEEVAETSKIEETKEKEAGTDKSFSDSADFLIIDEKLVNIDYKLAKCCSPILGDKIFGFVTINQGIKIHRTSCPNAAQLHQKYGYRVVNAKWKQTTYEGSFQTTIKISGIDQIGITSKLTEVISKDFKVNMRSFSVQTANGIFEAHVQVFIPDKKHLEMLLYRLGRIKGVQKAERIGSE